MEISKFEYDQLIKDRNRLDWVEENLNALVEEIDGSQHTEWLIEAASPWRATVREAIDKMTEDDEFNKYYED